jgi:hypothetical protein
MGKYVVSLLAVVSLATPAVAAQARPVERSARTADLYPIPPASGPTPAGAAGAAVAYLAKLSPAALAATNGPKLGVDTPGPGTFTLVLSARIHGKRVVIATGRTNAPAAEATTVRIRFTKAGRAALAGVKGRLLIVVVASFMPEHGKASTASRTVTLK